MLTTTSDDMSDRFFQVIDDVRNSGYQVVNNSVIERVTPATPVDNPGMFA